MATLNFSLCHVFLLAVDIVCDFLNKILLFIIKQRSNACYPTTIATKPISTRKHDIYSTLYVCHVLLPHLQRHFIRNTVIHRDTRRKRKRQDYCFFVIYMQEYCWQWKHSCEIKWHFRLVILTQILDRVMKWGHTFWFIPVRVPGGGRSAAEAFQIRVTTLVLRRRTLSSRWIL